MTEERVLVVEDDFANMVGALKAFEGKKVKIKGVNNYEDFLKELDEYKPTCVLSDAQIPEKKGEMATNHMEKISKELDKRKIPYIFVTRGTTESEISHATGRVSILGKERGEYRIIKTFNTAEKEAYIWEEAYELVKKKRA